MSFPIDFKQQLVAAYDADADRRSIRKDRHGWKAEVRDLFIDRLKREGKKSILEVGAGAGVDAQFFSSKGFDVLATDLSPKMVDACRAAGLTSAILDVYDINSLGRRFDAVFSMNVLLHIPPEDLGQILANIASVLEKGGLFFYGVYGGTTKEEITTDPTRMNLPRYFSFLNDEALLNFIGHQYEIVDFKSIGIKDEQAGLHFQFLLLRKI
ncbi:MAG TPA: class I SAM-dependent methyltransferase [Candidatus Saccharimonadales bacterium]